MPYMKITHKENDWGILQNKHDAPREFKSLCAVS